MAKRTGRRHPDEGGYARGEEAKTRIIEAALEIFGANGFEGTSTRAIASAADVKLPALQYYFGGKEGLYLACADFVAGHLEEGMNPALARIDELLAQEPDPETAEEALEGLLGGLAETLLGDSQPETWVMFVLREQARPTEAFEPIYARAIGRITHACVRLVSVVLGKPDTDSDVRIRAFALIGQVLAFRTLKAAALRTVGWDEFNEDRLAQIRRAILTQVGPALGR